MIHFILALIMLGHEAMSQKKESTFLKTEHLNLLTYG